LTRLIRPLAPLAAAALLCASGCGPQGRYDLRWRFAAVPTGVPATARDCGLHGVDSIAISGSNDSGDGDRGVVACGALHADRSVAPGVWTLLVVALDRDGHPREPDAASTLMRARPSFGVSAGETTPVDIYLEPLPACRDGIDNDADGAVDLDDPDCAGMPEAASE